jgi:hypothetical protein
MSVPPQIALAIVAQSSNSTAALNPGMRQSPWTTGPAGYSK